MEKPIITGWCNVQEGHPEPLHRKCHGVYTSRQNSNEVTYKCGCRCHARKIRKPATRRIKAIRPRIKARRPE